MRLTGWLAGLEQLSVLLTETVKHQNTDVVSPSRAIFLPPV
jgi:hypothetical protein